MAVEKTMRKRTAAVRSPPTSQKHAACSKVASGWTPLVGSVPAAEVRPRPRARFRATVNMR